MRGAFVTEYGPAGTVTWGELPDPASAPGHVVVKVLAAAVDHVDTFVRAGSWPTEVTWPLVVGRDLVGEVVEPSDSAYQKGQLVWTSSAGYGRRPGATAELVAVQTGRCYPLPDVDPVQAVATFHGAATATLALRRVRLAVGEQVFVHGAGGGVGSVVVAAAMAAGAIVTATARDDASVAWLRELSGRVSVIDTRVQEPHPRAVDVHWDATGTIPLDAALRSCAGGGRVVVTARRETDAIASSALYLADQSVVGFVMSGATRADLGWAAEQTNQLLAAGLRVRIGQVLPMSEAGHAHQLMEAGRAHGKIVLVPPQ
ncbi:MAG: zinc-binding dehydrogenase [Sciscionella sp.]